MPIDTPSLIAILLEQHLLDGAAENALPELSLTCANPSDLVSELVRRRWLTHFQAELILAGRVAELIVGQYVLLERLGQGGMGTVYKARHRVLKAVRALKIIHPERLTGPHAVKRFFQEVEAVGKLFHPNIILPHDAGETGGIYFLAMEYVPGADLGRLLDRSGPLPASDACEYIRQGAMALQHAHERGLVHRDIKPANLLVSSADGRVKLLDLGLARVRALEEGCGPQTALTQAGAMMGTPDYMAPEQAIDSHGVDIRADIYALGCTLYHVLVGRPPFSGGSVMDKLVKHRTEEPKPLELSRNDLPAGLNEVLRKAMAKSPDDRYQTPAELASALAPFCSDASPAKPRPAGASGVHPAFPPVTRPSLPTIPGRTGLNRAPTPPARPTVTAPRGAMPSPSERTVTSLETRLDPTARPLAAKAAPAPAAPIPKKRINWITFVAMVLVGIAIAGGARFFLAGEKESAAPPPQALKDSSPLPSPVVPVHKEPERDAPAPDPAPPERVEVAVAKDGGKLNVATARTRGSAQLIAGSRPLPTGQRATALHSLSGDQVHAAAFSGDGGRAAVVTDRNLEVYGIVSRGDRITVPLENLAEGLPDPGRTPSAVALSPDGRHAYFTTTVPAPTARENRTKGTLFNAVVHWEDQQTPEVLFGPPVEGTGKPDFRCVAASSDGGVLAAGSLKPHQAFWWNRAVKPPRRSPVSHLVGEPVEGLAFSADGRHVLFCGHEPPELYLHTLGLFTGAPPLPMTGHKGAQCAGFSADGRFAVTGGRDGKLCVWDFSGPPPADGVLRPAKELSWHQGPVTAVAFAPSGDRFVSGGEDGFVCIGEVARQNQLLHQRPEDAPARVFSVACTGDGASALYATERSIGRFDLRPPALAVARKAGGAPAAVAKVFATR